MKIGFQIVDDYYICFYAGFENLFPVENQRGKQGLPLGDRMDQNVLTVSVRSFPNRP